MKNLNYKPYQAYHPYNTPQQHQPHHPYNHQQLSTLQQSQQQQQQQRPAPPTQLTNYQTQQQQQQHLATITHNTTSMQMSPLAAANFLPNQYNLNYSNLNNNINNANNNNNNGHLQFVKNHYNNNYNILQQQNQQQQLQQMQFQPQPQSQQQQQSQRNDQPAPNCSDKFSMDACEIANFLANELFMQQLVSVDGIQSGVPTLTTSTLTPTTLRSIEETFIQLTSEPINAPYAAGFIPPPLAPFSVVSSSANATPFNDNVQDYNDAIDTESEDSQVSWTGAHLNEENSMPTTDTSSAATDSLSFQNGLNGMGNNSLATSNASSTNDFTAAIAAASAAKNGGINTPNTSNSATTTATPRRNQGGRRPTKATNMSPEEEEKRRVRRERNKLAAARCRKRRVDQTNELLEEVAILDKKRECLQKDIETLNSTKQELEYFLESHRPTCQKIRQDLLSVSTFGGLIAPTTTATTTTSGSNCTITGLDRTLASTERSDSPIDLKPVILNDQLLDIVPHIKHEPLDNTLDSNSSLDDNQGALADVAASASLVLSVLPSLHDRPSTPKRIMMSRNNPMVPPPLPNVATLSASLAAASASLNTPIMTTAPVSFSTFGSSSATLNTLNALNALHKPQLSKQRPNSLPTMPRNLGQNLALSVDGKPPTDINGVAIQTPSTGMFNFDSLMDGGTGLTPVSGPLVPTCSSQNKHPLELTTPTSEPSKLVSL